MSVGRYTLRQIHSFPLPVRLHVALPRSRMPLVPRGGPGCSTPWGCMTRGYHLVRYLHPVQPLRLSRFLHHHPAGNRGGGRLDGCGPVPVVLVGLPSAVTPTHCGGGAVPGHVELVLERPAVRHGAFHQEQNYPSHYGGRGKTLNDRLRRRQRPWIMTAVIFTSIPTILLFVGLRRFLHPGNGAQHQFVRGGADHAGP